VIEEVYYEDQIYDEDYYPFEDTSLTSKETNPPKFTVTTTNHSPSSLTQNSKNNNTTTVAVSKLMTEDNRNPNNLACAICMNVIEPTKKARVDNCKHEFCCECIEAWAQTKLSCPLCNVNFDKLLINFSTDGKSYEEKRITIAPKGISTTISDDLQCLDHTYFLQEINRLLIESEAMQRQVIRQSQSRLKNTWENTKSNILQDLISTLRAYRESFSDFCAFEPELMLRELYDLQDELAKLRKGPNALSQTNARSQSAASVRYSADDCFDDDLLEDMNSVYIKKKPNSQRVPANKKKQQKAKSLKK